MFSFQRFAKLGYVVLLGSAVFVLSRPAPVRAQRTLAYPFLPSAIITSRSMSQLLASAAVPMTSYNMAMQQLMQAGIPAGMSVAGGQGMNGGAMGMGGGGGGIAGAMGMGGGNMMGMSGGMMGMGGGGMRGGMGGMGGGMMGGGMRGGMGGGMGGMGGGMGGMGGLGGMGGGFAGKGFGGFNGKKPL